MNIQTIIATLKADEHAVALTIKHDEEALVAHLKAFYERVYGAVHADIYDWTHAAAQMKAHVETAHDEAQAPSEPVVPPPATDPPAEPVQPAEPAHAE
jgi:hypothetical protein